MFIVTANTLDTIQPAFLDRMEVIRLSGYTDEEKLMIAKQHLIPKQMEENGIAETKVVWTDGGIMRVITGYTKEAGLRNLEREIGTICRKIAVQVAEGKVEAEYRITDANVDKYLGPMKHFAEELLERDQVGVATGLAWTAVGGDVVRSYYSGRLLNNQALAAVSIFVERFTGILMLFFLVAFAPLLAPELYRSPYILVPAAAGLVLIAITWLLLRVRDPLALPTRKTL